MKKTISFILTLALFVTVCPVSMAEIYLFNNVHQINAYREGQFVDVSKDNIFLSNIRYVYEIGLMLGKAEDRFDPTGQLTIAETIVLADRIHSIANRNNQVFENGLPWYQPYLDYADNNKLNPYQFDDYMLPVTRAVFAVILGKSVKGLLPEMNKIEDGVIPDVSKDSDYYEDVYALYRAGILTGSDDKGTFRPDSQITRGESAAIVSRIINNKLRKKVELLNTINGLSDLLRGLDSYDPEKDTIVLTGELGVYQAFITIPVSLETPYKAEFRITVRDGALVVQYLRIFSNNIEPATVRWDNSQESTEQRAKGYKFEVDTNTIQHMSSKLDIKDVKRWEKLICNELASFETRVLNPAGYSLKDMGFDNFVNFY